MRKSRREGLKRSIYPKLVINELEMIKKRVQNFNNRFINRMLWDNNSEEVLAWSMMADGRFYEALSTFEKLEIFFKMNDRVLEYTINRCLCLMELGRIEDAEKEFGRLIYEPRSYGVIDADNKTIDAVMLIIAMREFVHKRYHSALDIYQEMIQEQENDFFAIYALRGMGEINEKLGKVKDANVFYYKAWEDGGDLYSSRYALNRLNKLKITKIS